MDKGRRRGRRSPDQGVSHPFQGEGRMGRLDHGHTDLLGEAWEAFGGNVAVVDHGSHEEEDHRNHSEEVAGP